MVHTYCVGEGGEGAKALCRHFSTGTPNSKARPERRNEVRFVTNTYCYECTRTYAYLLHSDQHLMHPAKKGCLMSIVLNSLALRDTRLCKPANVLTASNIMLGSTSLVSGENQTICTAAEAVYIQRFTRSMSLYLRMNPSNPHLPSAVFLLKNPLPIRRIRC